MIKRNKNYIFYDLALEVEATDPSTHKKVKKHLSCSFEKFKAGLVVRKKNGVD